jgi:hypothetical protein
MKIECDCVRDGHRNFSDDASSRINAVGDDHNFHRTPDVSQIENGLGQIHFFPRRNQDGGVKDFPTDFIDSAITIADFCDDTGGPGKTLFHRVTTLRTNQQGLVKPSPRITDRRYDTHVWLAEESTSAKTRVLNATSPERQLLCAAKARCGGLRQSRCQG